MNYPVTICRSRGRLPDIPDGQALALSVTDSSAASRAAAEAAARGRQLAFIIVDTDILSTIAPRGLPVGVPIVVVARSFGRFLDMEDSIPDFKARDISVHLPCHSRETMTGLAILASLGVACTAVFGQQIEDWDALADLAAWALLSPVPHAPLEPFAHMAANYRQGRYLAWDDLHFNDPQRYVHRNDRGRILSSDRGLQRGSAGKAIPAQSACARCRGRYLCGGRFRAEAHKGECSAFFVELVDVVSRYRKRQAGTGCANEIPVHAPPVTTSEIVGGDRAVGPRRTSDTVWIDLRGGASEALVLSGVLKQLKDKERGRRFNLVSRTGLGSVLAGHQAIERTGHPPKGAAILRVTRSADAGESPYRRFAAILGLHGIVEERPFVPWDFEDNDVLMAMVPRGVRNILICPGPSSAGRETALKKWEAFVAMLRAGGASVVEAGLKDDPYVHGSYSILGLTTDRQTMSLPRRFDAVVASEGLMVHAARLCNTPAIVISPADGPGAWIYPGQVRHTMKDSAQAILRSVRDIIEKS